MTITPFFDDCIIMPKFLDLTLLILIQIHNQLINLYIIFMHLLKYTETIAILNEL